MGGKKVKQFKIVCVLLLSLGLLTGCSEKEVIEDVMETYAYVASETSYVLENQYLKMEMDPATTYFQVTNKEDGSVWSSNPLEGAEDPIADGASKNLLQSTLVIEYSTPTGVNTIYNNYEYSIKKGIYEIEQGNDYIKVNHTIGNTEKIFLMPTVISESRLQPFLDQMDKSGQKQIREYYRKYDLNNLRSTDNKTELLAQYLDLANECVYVVRDGLQDYINMKLETAFVEAGYTEEDYAIDQERNAENSSSEKPLFNVSILYRLEGNDLVVELPMEEMSWRSEYPLTKVKVLPYLGAGSTEDEGFLLVPEGTGAIIEFNNGKKAQSAYYTDIYGWDYAMKRSALIDESRSSYGVFGIGKESSSLLCLIEEGSALATVEADVSGRSHSYNFANTTYRIVHSEGMDVSAKSDKSVMVFESEKPSGSLKQRYRFLDTGGYSNMAVAYRNYLLDRHPELVKKETLNVPVNVEIIGAIDRVKQRFGFPVTVSEPLTTYKEAKQLVEELSQDGYRNLTVKYSGWMNGGVTHKAIDKIKPDSELGSSKELKDFISTSESLGIPVYLSAYVQNAYRNKLLDGFQINRDAAKHVTREVVELREFSPVWYGEKDWIDSYHLLRPEVTASYINNLSQSAIKYRAEGIALNDIGYELGADYNPKNLITRSEVVSKQLESLKKAQESNQKVMVTGGNDYVIGYCDYITGLDFQGSEFGILDYNVPFYTMALHGLVEYSGKALNLSNDYEEMLLKSAETGAGIAFTFMLEPVATLQETNYTKYFGADYDKWRMLAMTIYSRYEEELGHCFNQYMIAHEKLAEGVFVSTYEDGTKVYVNYNNVDYRNGNVQVLARDYSVERGE